MESNNKISGAHHSPLPGLEETGADLGVDPLVLLGVSGLEPSRSLSDGVSFFAKSESTPSVVVDTSGLWISEMLKNVPQ